MTISMAWPLRKTSGFARDTSRFSDRQSSGGILQVLDWFLKAAYIYIAETDQVGREVICHL